MKKIFKNLLSLTVLALPIVSLPLINATYKNETGWDETFTWGDKGLSTYTVHFDTDDDQPDWGVFATIKKIYLNPNDTATSLVIPGTVTSSTIEYKVRRIDTDGRCSGSGNIQELDLSQAVWLDEICSDAFSKNYGDCPFNIKSVYWSGARRLTKVNNWAFEDQSFSCDAGRQETFNFYNTGINEISSFVFKNCCESNKNCFDKLVLPRSLRKLGYDTFSVVSDKSTAPRFNKVIITDSNAGFMPYGGSDQWPKFDTSKASTNQVVVPYGSSDAWKYIFEHSEGSYMINYMSESCIEYTSEHSGSYKPCGQFGKAGTDELTKTWAPYDFTTQSYRYDCTPLLDNDYDGLIGFDSLGHLTWSNQLPIGQYTFRVYAYCYDDTRTKLSCALSTDVTLTIASVNCSGGSLFLQGSSSQSGYDSGWWTPTVTSTPAKTVVGSSYTLSNFSSSILEDKLHTEVVDNKCRIKWDSSLPAGIYTFTLQPKVLLEDTDTQINLESKNISLIIQDDTEVNIKLTYSIDGAEYQEYTGQFLKLTGSQEVTFKIKLGADLATGETSPKMSIELGNLTGSGTEWQLKMSTAQSYLQGKYSFCIYAKEKQQLDPEVDAIAYSPMINVQIGDLDTSAIETPNDVYIDKSKSEIKYTLPIITSGNAIIYGDIDTFEPASWQSGSARASSVTATVSEDKKSVILTFPSTYFEYTDPYDVLDYWLALVIVDESTNSDPYIYAKSFSVTSTNSASIEYKGSSFVTVKPDCKYTHSEPIKYLLNGEEIEKDNDIRYTYSVTATDPSIYTDHINLVKSSVNNSALLSFDGMPLNDETKQGLPITIRIGDVNNLAVATIDMTIYVASELEVCSLPPLITAQEGQAGKSYEKVYTKLNGEIDPNVTYEIKGIADPGLIEIDDEGYVSWNDKIPAGEYNLSLTATSHYQQEELKVYKEFKFIVKAKTVPGVDKKVAIIAGSSTGAAVATSGTTAGIVVGVNKHKAKIKKK